MLAESVLDDSMPAAGVPFCMAAFQQGAPVVLGENPAAKVSFTSHTLHPGLSKLCHIRCKLLHRTCFQ